MKNEEKKELGTTLKFSASVSCDANNGVKNEYKRKSSCYENTYSIWEIISDWLFFIRGWSFILPAMAEWGITLDYQGIFVTFCTHFAPSFKASFYKLRTIATKSLAFYFENKKSQSTDENSLTFKGTK